jgi:hypothetical protein
VISTDVECGSKLTDFSCENRDAMRNTIYASHGKVFVKKRWKAFFHDRSWYKPDATFSEAAVTPLQIENISQLKQGCHHVTIPSQEERLIKEWINADARLAKQLPASTQDAVDGQLWDVRTYADFSADQKASEETF